MGGNEKFQSFMDSYGPEGGYSKSASMHERYHCWAAAQYREKVRLVLSVLSIYRTAIAADAVHRGGVV
jgi:hypothetical protein